MAGMSGGEHVEYPEEFIAEAELIWGEGFISPGGAREVALVVEGVDLRGKEVLDIGVGFAGPACLLVEVHGAARVTGVDVQEAVLAKAAAFVRARGLADRIMLRHVEPGPLPFPEASFDVIFSKEAIAHIEDKAAIFREAYRVLRPGGRLLISDWYSSSRLAASVIDYWTEKFGVSLALAPSAEQAVMLESAGFVDIVPTDRSSWYRETSVRDAERMSTTEREKIVAVLGERGAETLVKRAKVTALAVKRGWLRPGHLRARKPG